MQLLRKTLKTLLILLISVMLLALSFFMVIFIIYTNNSPSLDYVDMKLSALKTNNEIIPFEEISTELINATLAVEDWYFFERTKPKKSTIFLLVLENISANIPNNSMSAISLLLARNIYLLEGGDVNCSWEYLYAFRLETKYSKNDILEMYLNSIFYEENVIGVQEASQYYFGKNASDLNLAESAFLVGIKDMPIYFDYSQRPDRVLKRKDAVLKTMNEAGYITYEEMLEAQNDDINVIF